MYMQTISTWFKENQTAVLSVGGVVLVIAIIIGAAMLRGPKDSGVSITEPEGETALVPQVQGPAYVANEEVTVAPAKPSYDMALAQYGDRRIQFGENCAAAPTSSVWKTGTEVMLDNRSSESHLFRVNGVAYTVAAYDFVIASFTSTKSPDEVLIDCGTMQNVATITIQK